MTTATLRATDLVSFTGTVSEVGGVVETTLADASDATGFSMTRSTTAEATASMSLTNLSIGTGRLKSWYVQFRRVVGSGVSPPLRVSLGMVSVASDFGLLSQILDQPPSAFATVTAAAQVPPSMTATQLNDLGIVFSIEPGTSGAITVSEMLVSVTYAVAPTANITYPTGSPTITTTSTPTATWTHAAGSDGGSQSAYQVKAFTAAQYGAGGFDPETSTAAYDSGVITSSSTAAAVGPLANSTTFKVYLKTAQTVNGSLHWSAWDNEIVSTSFTPATVSSVTASATAATGLITVTVNHSGAAWVDVELERTDDGGTTWVPVRGATKVTATNTFVTAWSSTAVVVKDYEAPNGVTVTYRARASTALITGAYTSSSTTSWTSPSGTTVWLKDPLDPTLNVELLVPEMPQPTRDVAQGIFPVINASFPVVVSDARQARVGVFVGQTRTLAAGSTFELAVENQVKLLQFPATHLWGSKYIALGPVTYSEAVVNKITEVRNWQIAYTQIDRPADETDY